MKNREAKRLKSQICEPLSLPIIGRCLQKKAVIALAEDGSLNATRVLAEAVITLEDGEIKGSIFNVLNGIKSQECIDSFCGVWANTRQKDLTKILVKKSWVATAPAKNKVLSALKANKLQAICNSGAEIIKSLLNAFQDTDAEIANRASQCVLSLTNLEAIDYICHLALEHKHQLAYQIVMKAQYAPHEPSQRALFYFLTEQWDKYESLDYDHTLLQKVYELGNEKIRKKIENKARQAGHIVWVEIIAGEQKDRQLSEMTDADWKTTIKILSQNKNWGEMWQLAQKAPAIWSVKLLLELNKVIWMPQLRSEQVNFTKLKHLASKCSNNIPLLGKLTYCTKTIDAHNNRWINRIDFSPDGKLLASCSSDGTVKLWQTSTGKLLHIFTDHTDSVEYIDFSSDGKLLASCSSDGTVKLWQTSTKKLVRTIDNDNLSKIDGIIFSPDSKLLLSFDSEGVVKIRQVKDNKLICTFDKSNSFFYDGRYICFSPDSKFVADTSSGNIRLWRMSDGKLLQDFKADFLLDGISFSPDGKFLATWSIESLKLWLVPDGKLIKKFGGDSKSSFIKAVFAPDGQLIASFFAQTIQLWRISDGKLITNLTEHIYEIVDISFSPDGKTLASCGYDNAIKLWQMPNGNIITTLTGHNKVVEQLSFNHSSTTLASCSDDRTIKLWLSDLPLIAKLPIKKLNQQNQEFIVSALKDITNDTNEKYWLKFIQELINLHRRFDVEVEDTALSIDYGEFDIEIEG